MVCDVDFDGVGVARYQKFVYGAKGAPEFLGNNCRGYGGFCVFQYGALR